MEPFVIGESGIYLTKWEHTQLHTSFLKFPHPLVFYVRYQ